MTNTQLTIVAVLVIAVIVGAIAYQRARAQAAREAFLRQPGQQLAMGVGNLIGGIVGFATGGG
jgi:hypothetical protein